MVFPYPEGVILPGRFRSLDLPCFWGHLPARLSQALFSNGTPCDRTGDIYRLRRTGCWKPGWGGAGSGPPPRARGCYVRGGEGTWSHAPGMSSSRPETVVKLSASPRIASRRASRRLRG